MDIVQRVAKAAKEAGEIGHHEPEAVARAVIATMFNWLGDPSSRAIDAGVIGGHHDAMTCRTAWAAMLAEMRKEAGF